MLTVSTLKLITILFVKKVVCKGIIATYNSIVDQITDIFTKGLIFARFILFCDKLMAHSLVRLKWPVKDFSRSAPSYPAAVSS